MNRTSGIILILIVLIFVIFLANSLTSVNESFTPGVAAPVWTGPFNLPTSETKGQNMYIQGCTQWPSLDATACQATQPAGTVGWMSCPMGYSPLGLDPSNPSGADNWNTVCTFTERNPGISAPSFPCKAGQNCYALVLAGSATASGTAATSGQSLLNVLKVTNGQTSCITDNQAASLGIVPLNGRFARDQAAIAACQAAGYKNPPTLTSTSPCVAPGDTSTGYMWKCN